MGGKDEKAGGAVEPGALAGQEAEYRKLYFVWYFDDDEGYGIEVMAETGEEAIREGGVGSRFVSVANWSYGHGTEARDFRRAWGEYVADEAQKNGGRLPSALSCLLLRYDPSSGQCQGDIAKMKHRLSL
ncbi:hypothetical protein CEB3_c22310 [Peptococcaceae bacterium CEB3]|nr:hypothetical protein CEB3_c22310 [Peptococcaceae bacterium CEB3]